MLSPSSGVSIIQVYFDDYTKTFDEIERSQKATVTVILSTIGGTMGLLTGFSLHFDNNYNILGFSLLSGIEIVYYAAKMFFTKVKEKTNIERINNLK